MPDPHTITASQLLFERGAILKRIYRDKQHIIVEKNEMPIVAMLPIEQYWQLLKQSGSSHRSV